MKITFTLVFLLAVVAGATADITVNRFANNPVIDFTMVQQPCDGTYDINFPSIIKVPAWLPNPLGQYYAYFSDHHGLYVYLAYANDLHGPWTVRAAPTLTLQQVFTLYGLTYNPANLSTSAECAAADIFIDDVNQQIRMYVHHRIPSTAYASYEIVAFSTDGMNFAPQPDFLGQPYMRTFRWSGDDYVYILDRRGLMLRSLDGYTNLESGGTSVATAFTNFSIVNGDGFTGLVRHLGVSVSGNMLYIFGSRVGDAPERILYTSMDLTCTLTNWTQCQTNGPAIDAFRTETDYEGLNFPIAPSKKGSATGVHQIRDPYVIADNNHCYIFYTVAGEGGIAGAEIDRSFCYDTPLWEVDFGSGSSAWWFVVTIPGSTSAQVDCGNGQGFTTMQAGWTANMWVFSSTNGQACTDTLNFIVNGQTPAQTVTAPW